MRERLSIVQVVGSDVGGDWFVDICTRLSDRGHAIRAVTPGDGPLTKRLRDGAIQTHVIRFKGRRLRDASRLVSAQMDLTALLRDVRPDVLHSHLFKAILVSRLAGWMVGVPLRVAQWPGDVHLDMPVLRWLDRMTMPMDHRIIGSSRAITRHYETVAPGRAVTVPYGLDTAGWDIRSPELRRSPVDVRTELGIPPTTPLVGMIAYMYSTAIKDFHGVGIKGHETFLDAASIVAAHMPEARFLVVGDELVGDGSYRRALEDRAARLKLRDRLSFLGARADVKRLTAALDVLVVPSMRESASYAAVQGLLLERGVVASDVGGLPDTVEHGVTGLLATPGSAASFAAAIERLLRDDDMRNRFGIAGRQTAMKRFDIEATVDQLEEIYRSGYGHRDE